MFNDGLVSELALEAYKVSQVTWIKQSQIISFEEIFLKQEYS